MNTARFQVTTVWKGPTQTEIEVKALNGNTSCGVHFPPGEYLVFAEFARDGSRAGAPRLLAPKTVTSWRCTWSFATSVQLTVHPSFR
ncbi:hypothetical protein D187_004048 [Cystobacter fuscus DSM 2262]|uniref:Uncharacterized protein n=1 Tax=Cystobacter fuscus (strain ATCC 25194 / DSM 2262 / NBRC 100088 / M29) TaxID=1242864 RepID=S9P7U1_CYSF2|nr:hypothetical protein D187_004048 [Cystobacter fuscus DSM 2262]